MKPSKPKADLLGLARTDSADPVDPVKVHFRGPEDRTAFLSLLGEHPLRRGDVQFNKSAVRQMKSRIPSQLKKERPRTNLFGETAKESWENLWTDMPDFSQQDLASFDSVRVVFQTAEDRSTFVELLGDVVQQGSLWYPKMEWRRVNTGQVAEKAVPRNKYPVYVISKGRWNTRHTAKALEKLGIPYKIVVEPQEYGDYSAVIEPKKILRLPFSNLGQGSIPARNWVWEHAIKSGAARHWILDDNMTGFYRRNNNAKIRVTEENPFSDCERFSDRYSNVAISGLNYFMFASNKDVVPPFYLNTRVYSCILIKNDIPYRWRGRYNEDTDLCLRALKDGWCTVLFNAFLVLKMTTMTVKGGNTDELYAGDGRLLMAQSLQQQHPLHVKITQKWGRWQHHVNYRDFKKNKLVPVSGV